MGNGFYKFKKKILIESLIKCLSVGLAVGLIVVFLPLLILKIKNIEFPIYILISNGLGALTVVSSLLFLFLFPRNLKVAKRLDKQLNLNEKVQTMLEYQNQEGTMIEIQRKDTTNILDQMSLKKLTMKFSVFFIVFISIISVFAVTVTITALAIPEKNTEIVDDNNNQNIDGDEEPPFELDDWTTLAIKNIIEYVKEADMNESLKIKYVVLLEDLIVDLQGIDKSSEMETLVKTTVTSVLYELDKVNTNKEIYEVLRESKVTAIRGLSTQINKLDPEQVENAIDSLNIFIGGNKGAIIELQPDFRDLLKNSVLANAIGNDKLFKSLINFATELNDVSNSETVNVATMVEEVINRHKTLIIDAVNDQKANSDVANYIKDKLFEIFEIVIIDEDIDPDINDGTQDGEDGDDTNDQDKIPDDNTGGLGSGEVIFGSDDAFFDPDLGSVSYGDVINKYSGGIRGRFENGTIPQDLLEFYIYYYDILYNIDSNKNQE